MIAVMMKVVVKGAQNYRWQELSYVGDRKAMKLINHYTRQ